MAAIEIKKDSKDEVRIINGNHQLEIAENLGLKEVSVKYNSQESFAKKYEKLYNENEIYVEEKYNSYGNNRSSKEVIENNDRNRNNERYSLDNSEQFRRRQEISRDYRISSEIVRYNNRPSSNPTYGQNYKTMQAKQELENSFFDKFVQLIITIVILTYNQISTIL